MTFPFRVAVLISGSGTNLQAIMDAIQQTYLTDVEIVVVLSNRSKAFGLERARSVHIPTLVHTLKPYRDQGKTREDYDRDLAQLLLPYKPDLIVLAGFMHILTHVFIDAFQKELIINLHPALPGQFDGAHAIERAFEAYQKGEITQTGVMVHEVIPEVDRGPVLGKRIVDIVSEDTLASLEDKIHKVEHQLLVDVIREIVSRSRKR